MKQTALNHPIKVGTKRLNLYYYENNFWLTLNSIAEFFNKPVSHIYQVLKQLEKTNKINLTKFNKHLQITLKNGKHTVGNFFSFELLIAVAYKINPKKALELHKTSITSFQKLLLEPAKQKRGFMSILRGA